MREHTIKYPLSREETLIKPLADCENLICRKPIFFTATLFIYLIVLGDKIAFLNS